MSLPSLLAKLVLLALAALVIGLPIVHTALVLLFLGLILWTVLGTLRWPAWPALLWPALAFLALLGLGLALPEIRMQEGQNLFLVDGNRHEAALKAALPSEIYDYAAAQFLKFHPPGETCATTEPCWRGEGDITVPFAFTPDGALQSPEMSKITDFPNFDGLGQLRAGFRNAEATAGLPSTNWFDTVSGSSDPARAIMPFFVVYEVPTSLVGQTVCWKGDRFLVRAGQPAVHAISRYTQCQTIEVEDAGARFYGLSIDPRLTLSVNFRLSPTHPMIFHLLRLAARALAALALVLTLVRPDWTELRRFAVITAPLALVAGVPVFAAYENPFYASGNDPLVHWGTGERILQAAAAGNWWEAGRGVESVFYFMPGYRYFRALEMAVFGDSGFLSFAWIMASAYLIVTLARRLGGDGFAIVSIPLAYIAFATAASGLQGLAESVAYPIAVLAFGLALKDVSGENPPSAGGSFIIALLLALATLLRPNLGPCALVTVGVALMLGPRPGLWYRGLAASFGLAPISLLLIHNLAYGGRFVLATVSAGVDLITPPAAYPRALGAIVTGHWGSPDLQRILTQLGQWLAGLGGLPIIAFALLVAASTYWLGRRDTQSTLAAYFHRPQTLVLTAALAGLELPLFFFRAEGRYAELAGLTASVLVLHLATVFADKRQLLWTPEQMTRAISLAAGRLVS